MQLYFPRTKPSDWELVFGHPLIGWATSSRHATNGCLMYSTSLKLAWVGYSSTLELQERSSTQSSLFARYQGSDCQSYLSRHSGNKTGKTLPPFPGSSPYTSSSSVSFLHVLLTIEFMLKWGLLICAFCCGALASALLMGVLPGFARSNLMSSKPQKLSLQDSFPYFFSYGSLKILKNQQPFPI